MIKTFKRKGLKLYFSLGDESKLSPNMVDRISDILSILEGASVIEDINQPYLRLHPLKGNMKGLYSVTVRANWRIIFRVEDGDIFDVDFIDYH